MRISGPAKQMVSRPKPIFLMLEKIEGRQNGLTLGFSTKCDFFQKFFQSKCHTLIFCRNKEFCEHRGFLRHLRFLRQNAIYGRIKNIAKMLKQFLEFFLTQFLFFFEVFCEENPFSSPRGDLLDIFSGYVAWMRVFI